MQKQQKRIESEGRIFSGRIKDNLTGEGYITYPTGDRLIDVTHSVVNKILTVVITGIAVLS